ncbi:MAG: hypothetical protein ACTSSG_09330 [Candidatus Heimdallarchaeaceae archaeon]
MSIIEFFDNMDWKDFLWSSLLFLATFVTGYIIGFLASLLWVIITASIIAGLFLLWSFMYVIVNYKEWKKETEILVELPSFPEKTFCDICGKELEGGERRTDGNFLSIICPSCGAENVLSSEQKIQELSKVEP